MPKPPNEIDQKCSSMAQPALVQSPESVGSSVGASEELDERNGASCKWQKAAQTHMLALCAGKLVFPTTKFKSYLEVVGVTSVCMTYCKLLHLMGIFRVKGIWHVW